MSTLLERELLKRNKTHLSIRSKDSTFENTKLTFNKDNQDCQPPLMRSFAKHANCLHTKLSSGKEISIKRR